MSTPRLANSIAERIVAMDVVSSAFEVDEQADIFRARRLACPLRSTAQTWVVEDGGRIVSSLLLYPLTFGLPDGEHRSGYGLGAVSTLPSHQGRGHASRLCARACESAEAGGRGLGLLFSATEPRIYERLGFRIVPAWKHVTDRVGELAALQNRAKLAPLDPWTASTKLQSLYDTHHAGTLHLARDRAAWERTLLRQRAERPAHIWFADSDPDGDVRAVARISVRETDIFIEELLLADQSREEPMIAALAALAQELGLASLTSWLPPSPTTNAWFKDQGRADNLPMVRGDVDATRTLLWRSDYF